MAFFIEQENTPIIKAIGLRPAEPTIPYQLLSKQQSEPGKKSRPGGAAESEQLPPACIAFTFYPGGGLSSLYS